MDDMEFKFVGETHDWVVKLWWSPAYVDGNYLDVHSQEEFLKLMKCRILW